MSTDLPKTYDPSAVESEAYRVWRDERCFHAEPGAGGEPYAIVIPPPNVTAPLHLGHALNNTVQDVLIRYHRMRGDNTCWLPGTDHAGIATQGVVDRRLTAEGQPALKDYKRMEAAGQNGREQFLAKVQAWKDEYERKITDQLVAMGCSCDWDRQAFTMDEPRAKAVREAFFRLFRDGLIYRGKRLVNWDPVSLTALSDDEVEMEEVDGQFYYLRYPLVGAGEGESGGGGEGEKGDSALSTRHSALSCVTVATTRPETMLGDTAVAINPKDPRAAQLRGRKVLLPIVNREIPIVEDDYVVLPVSLGGSPDDPKAQFATGFLKVTPAHDPNDYEIGRRHDLQIINVMAPDASISDQHGWTDVGDAKFLLGKSREEARKLIVKWFKESGLLEEMKPYKHAVGHSYRSHVPVEPYLSDQWYCKVTDDRLAGAALRAMAPDQRTGSAESNAVDASRDRKGAEPPAERAAGQEPQTSTEPSQWPLAYFITFTTYGTWLHGDDKGSVDRDHNVPGTPYLIGDEARERRDFAQQGQPASSLDEDRRRVVQETVAEVSRHRGWALHVVHARTTHVHVVVSANVAPEKVMNDFKSYATRRLREAKLAGAQEQIWTRHGSTRYLHNDRALRAAGDYVHDRQGAAISPGPLVGADAAAQGQPAGKSDAGSAGAEPPLPDGRGSPEATSQSQLRFYPARYAKTFQTWHENIRDWCISRQLWWGHRIPVWRLAGDAPIPLDSQFWDRLAILGDWIDAERVVFKGEGIEFHPGGSVVLSTSVGDRVTDDLFICVRSTDDREVIDAIEAFGFTQDPDVLDTWFSSGLWPMSTLNWPGDTPELREWNPSSALCTAREIITLWVSRMVMFNCYFRGCLPFRDVFIHAMIQDGEGQKMSKTLGNGVDPLDIVGSHGADAMRFTLAAMTTQTQDLRIPVDLVDPHSGAAFQPVKTTISGGYVVAAPVQVSPKDPTKKLVSSFGQISGQAKPTPDMPVAKNTSGKFDLGRNFCNKIWNAARFALASLSAAGPAGEAVDESVWSMVDRWIVSRFNRTVAACDAALAEYRFDVYATSCYDFFWNDLCAWYLEAIKPAMRDPARAPQTAHVLAAVLDGSLRLMHPVIPFVTETIWWKLNEVRPVRGLPGRLECPPAERLVRAAWPTVGETSEAAEHVFPKVQELVSAIRQVRNDRQVNPKQVVSVSIAAPAERARSIEMNREVIEGLAACTLAAVGEGVAPPPNAAKAVVAGCEVFVEGLVDATAEAAKNAKRRDELVKHIAGMKSRLANEGYVAKAPPKVVEQTKVQLAAAEAELAKLG